MSTVNVIAESEYQDIVLDTPDAIDQKIFVGPGPARLGGVDPDISVRQVRLRIGRRPTVRNLRKLYEAVGLAYPKDLALFENYGVWLFSFKLHLMQDGGFESVRQLGFQVKYSEDYAISIVSQLPDSEFITKGGGKFKASATFNAVGDAKVPVVGASVGIASAQAGAEMHAEATANAEVNLSFSVMTDKVVATGTGDFLGEWSIKRGDVPLLGEQQFVHAVLVPIALIKLDVQVRSYVAVRTGYLVPARLASDWVKMSVSLDANAEVGRESP